MEETLTEVEVTTSESTVFRYSGAMLNVSVDSNTLQISEEFPHSREITFFPMIGVTKWKETRGK